MDGFGKLNKLRNGESVTEAKDAIASTASAVLALGGAGKERPFDCLPLHIQDWSRRCREASRHGK
jgi:hypothetical protein